jgi:hypothetical protein
MTDRSDRFGWKPGDLEVNADTPGYRPTGEEMFAKMTKAEQDEVFGPDVAQALRDGKLQLSDVAHVQKGPKGTPGFLVAKPPEELT